MNDWKKALEVFEHSDVNFADLITHTFTIEENEKAFSAIRNKGEFTLKVMFTFDD